MKSRTNERRGVLDKKPCKGDSRINKVTEGYAKPHSDKDRGMPTGPLVQMTERRANKPVRKPRWPRRTGQSER